MMRSLSALLILPLLPSCSLFCGGDTRPLIPVTWDEPRLALNTLLAAIENDDARRIYQSLGPTLKKEQGIDGLQFAVGWERLRQAQPYLHVAGQAGVIEEKRLPSGEHLYLLGVHGKRFTVRLEPLSYWQVLILDERELIRIGDYMDPALFEKRILNVSPDDGRILVELKSDELFGIQKAEIQGLVMSKEWKVRTFAEGTEGFED